MKRLKGFTITELVVVLAVSTILIASVVALTLTMSNYTLARNQMIDQMEELNGAKAFVTSIFNTYDESGKEFPTAGFSVGEGKILFVDGESTREFAVDTIVAVNIEQSGNFYKVTLDYFDGNKQRDFSFVLIRRSIA